jgi:hypothetical protein
MGTRPSLCAVCVARMPKGRHLLPENARPLWRGPLCIRMPVVPVDSYWKATRKDTETHHAEVCLVEQGLSKSKISMMSAT